MNEEMSKIYPNCPRYIPNLDTKKPSVYVLKWDRTKISYQHLNGKFRDYMKNILKKDDPHEKYIL